MTKILPILLDAFISATAGWNDEETGSYIRLLMHQYEKGSIPNDIEKLKRIAYSVEKNWPLLQEKFPEIENGKLQNKKMEAVREQIGPALDKLYTQIQKREKKEALKIIRESKPKNELKFPYNSPEFMNAWVVLMAEAKWRNKSHAALQTSLINIGKYAKNEKEAIQIIHNTIAGEWQGVFDLKPHERDNINGKQQFSVNKAGELVAVAEAARRISAERGMQNDAGRD